MGVFVVVGKIVPFLWIGDHVEQRHFVEVTAPRLLARWGMWDNQLEPAIANPAIGYIPRWMPEEGRIAGIDRAENGPGRKRLLPCCGRPKTFPRKFEGFLLKLQSVEQCGHDVDAAAETLVLGGRVCPSQRIRIGVLSPSSNGDRLLVLV